MLIMIKLAVLMAICGTIASFFLDGKDVLLWVANIGIWLILCKLHKDKP